MRQCLVAALLASSVFIGFTPRGSAQRLAQPDAGSAQPGRLAATIRYSPVSPAEAGVKLLEEVFMRVRSTPQVAMQTNNILQKAQSLQPTPSNQGPTDYNLAIRPKQMGKVAMMPSPTLQIVRTESNAPATIITGFSGTGGVGALTAKSGAAGLSVSLAGAASTGLEPPPPPATIDNWMGNRPLPVIASAGQPHAGVWEPSQAKLAEAQSRDLDNFKSDSLVDAASETSNFNDQNSVASRSRSSKSSSKLAAGLHPNPTRPTQIAKQDQSEGYSYLRKQQQGQRQPPDLATATNRLFDALNGLDTMQQKAASTKDLRSNQSGRLTDNQVEVTAYLAKDKNQAECKSKEESAQRITSAERQDAELSRRLSKRNSPSAPTVSSKIMDHSELDEGVNASILKSDSRKKTIAMSPADVALLPPNVVTGISFLRLGFSHAQASNALSQLGTLKTQKVSNWTVISCQRAQDKGATSVQLYLRNGLLDAMRIFDSKLIAADFGLTMGDNLSKVKEKFGEPAFILKEPMPGAGQNYIYPISQVGFQLARPAPGAQPRVVSVLIFNVK